MVKKLLRVAFDILTPLNGIFTRPNILLVPLLAFDRKKIDLDMEVDFMIEQFYI